MPKLSRKGVISILNSLCINNFTYKGKVHWKLDGMTNTYHEKGAYVTRSDGATLELKGSHNPTAGLAEYLRGECDE